MVYIAAIPIGLLGFSFYCLPITVALARGVDGVRSIAIVNVFLGWTLIGWLGAFMWACAAPGKAVRKGQADHVALMAANFRK